MGPRLSSRRALLLLASLPLLVAMPSYAQDAQEDEDSYDENALIIVTAAVRQGGAQDVKHFRSLALDELQGNTLPRPAGFTMEGLLGEHDLTLPPSGASCAQLFCINAHAMPANLAGRADDTQFIGIGFDSGVNAEAYRGEPVSLIAVVDRSGSMTGAPIARVREGLHAVIDAMREGDRLGIVLYGSDTLVHQEVIDVDGNREALHRAVDAIAINGSTYMEAGLKLGYATALEELADSNGRTRLMLFTDENPNVGDTSAEGFMGQAIAGSREGVGLTTIGVGAHFDGALATRISSVRGGNLFFLPREGAGAELFEREFTSMVSEVAQDITISITPAAGYRVSGVFGVPDDYLERGGSGTVTVSIGSAFLSSNGGGIYATLEGDSRSGDSALADISVAFTETATQRRGFDRQEVAAGATDRHPNLARAQLLVDEYLGITGALALFHEKKDAEGAAEILAALSERITSSGVEGMEQEIELVASLQGQATQLAGLDLKGTQPWDVFGEWRVVRHRNVADLSRGDRVEITEDGEFITERMSGRDAGEFIDQYFAINERQLHIEETDLVLGYRRRGDRLVLRNRLDGTEIVLERDNG